MKDSFVEITLVVAVVDFGFITLPFRTFGSNSCQLLQQYDIDITLRYNALVFRVYRDVPMNYLNSCLVITST